MCSFITQHNAIDVASFEGACNWHADCRNVHQSCCPWIERSFIYHKPSPKAFQRIWQYIQLASQPQTTCNHTSPEPPYPASSPQDRLRPATRTAAATIGLHNQIISAQTVRNRLRETCLHARRPHRGLDLTAVRRRNRLEWANAHIRWCLALWRGVLFTDESQFSLYRADGRQRVWHCVGERFAEVNVVDRVAHGGGGVMVWAGMCYGQRTQVHFIDGILNAQRCHDEILRPIVVPFIHDHHLMLQHDNARPHLYTIPGSWKHPSSCMASILTGHVTHWACLGCSGSAYTTACSSSCQYPATSHNHWRGVDQHSTGHNQQPDQLYAKEMCCTAWGKWPFFAKSPPPPPIQ